MLARYTTRLSLGITYGHYVPHTGDDTIWSVVHNGVDAINQLPFTDTVLDFIPFGTLLPATKSIQ